MGMMGIRVRGPNLFLACALLIGCGDEEEAPSVTPMPGTPMEIAAQPRLSLGVSLGDTIQEFYQMRTPFLLPGDRLAVPLEGSSEIRVFGPDGSFLQSLGRAGEGPGEFVALTSAWARGDTIEALDGDVMRITRLFPDGSTEVVRLEATGRGETAPPGAIPDGWVTVGWAGFGESGRDLWALQLFARDGRLIGEIAQIEGMARISVPGYSGPHPLSPRAVVRVALGRVYLAETLTPRIQVLGPMGAVEREITWATQDSINPRDALSLVRDSARARGDSDALDAFSEQLLLTDEIHEKVSVFWDFMVDELGFIWIRPYEPTKHSFSFVRFYGGGYIVGTSGRGGRWRIFSPEGVEVGSIEVPEGLALSQITRDAVIGIRTDPNLGFESVHVHALRRH
jgi:hypothetical protein